MKRPAPHAPRSTRPLIVGFIVLAALAVEGATFVFTPREPHAAS